MLLTGQSVDDIQENISLEWRRMTPRRGHGPGVISAADAYNRTGRNKSLDQKSARGIDNKNYVLATARDLVASDPNDNMKRFLRNNPTMRIERSWKKYIAENKK